MGQKKVKYDRLKVLRKVSRETSGPYGKSGSGYHMTQKDRPRVNKHLHEYLEEVDMENNITIQFSDILTAFQNSTIGTKVTRHGLFLALVVQAIKDHDFESERVPGQAVIDLPVEACSYVSAGVGKRTLDPDNYVAREYRGRVRLYLRRAFAKLCDSIRVVVYTNKAYIEDPDITEDELNKLVSSEATHILVAVLGSSGPKSPLSPGAFVHNLAGGNHEALSWTADEIRKHAEEIENYSNDWCVVAD